jgi:hypothetical protein
VAGWKVGTRRAIQSRGIEISGSDNPLKGEIEHIPLPDNSVDVIISNCVINLSHAFDRMGSDMGKSCAERIREIWPICAHEALSGSACEGKSRAHARISLNSLKCPIIERLVGGAEGI